MASNTAQLEASGSRLPDLSSEQKQVKPFLRHLYISSCVLNCSYMGIAVQFSLRGEVNSVNKEFAMELVVATLKELLYLGTCLPLQEREQMKLTL